jgi:thioredoxin
MASKVRVMKDDEEFANAIKDASAKQTKVVVDFNATWCGPCKAIAPLFASLSAKYPEMAFLSVDVDKCKEVAAALKVSSIPTFQFSVGDTVVKQQVGADKAKLEANIKALAEGTKDSLLKAAVDNGEAVEGEAEKIGEQDLTEALDPTRCECLNDSSEHSFMNIFKDDATYVESDTDEQLLFTVGFRKIVGIKSLKFIAPKDGFGPKKIKIFQNRPNMGFDDCADFKADKEVVLTAKDFEVDSPVIPLDYAKFIKVDTLTVFVEGNQGNKEQTRLSRLIIWGKKSH